MVTWFAGLFYMPRLLIYHVEASLKQEPDKSILSDQFKIMQSRLWKAIAWPSMILTWAFGLWLIILNQNLAAKGVVDNLMLKPWFILKLIFVFLLSLYHIQTNFIFKKHQRNQFDWSSFRLRIWNEVATVFLFAIIFLVIPKPETGWIYGILGLVLFILFVYSAIIIYTGTRENKINSETKNSNSEENLN
jgi:protoporphyrinogen IX oxidase